MALRKQQKVIFGFRCTDAHDEPTIVQYDGLHNLDLKRSEVANANRRHTYFSIKPLLNINKKKISTVYTAPLDWLSDSTM